MHHALAVPTRNGGSHPGGGGVRRLSIDAESSRVDLVLSAATPIGLLIPAIVDILTRSSGFRASPLAVHYQLAHPGGTALDCAKLAPVEVGLPAHSAPLGLSFLENSKVAAPWSGGAVVAVHGSWDRKPPRAPAVLWMPWNSSTHALGAAVNLVTGFQNANGDRWGRPADAVPGPDGALYVSDDTAGAIYRLVPPS